MKREGDQELAGSTIGRDEVGAEVRRADLISIQVTIGTHVADTATAVVARDCDVQLEHLIVERARRSWSCERGAVRREKDGIVGGHDWDCSATQRRT